MNQRKWIAAAALGAVIVLAASGIAVANGGRDTDKQLTGTALENAAAAALANTGGGTVVESEVGDDGAAYEVEVRLDNGNTVDVSLDASFNVTRSESDDDGAGDSESSDGAGQD